VPVGELMKHQMALGQWLSVCKKRGVRSKPIRVNFRHTCFLLAILFTLGLSGASGAEATNRAARNEYSSFKLINERNIFNSRRSPRYVPSDRRETRRTRSESFALVGTMKYEKGLFAFFDGTRSDYRKVLKQDDTIAGFKIISIEPSQVKLSSTTNELELTVGKQLRREDEGEWKLSDRPEVIEPVAVATARPVPVTATNQSADGNGDFSSDQPDLARIISTLAGGGPDGVPFAAEQALSGGTNVQPAVSSGGNDPESVLERLRRRREQQENP